MSSPLARPSRWLAPVVVLGAILWLTLVGIGGGRAAIERSIRTRWGSPVEGPGIARELDGYLKTYGSDPVARWFAIEALARVGRPADAADVAAADPGFAARPGALKRLASLLLETLGTYRLDPTQPTWLYHRAVAARIEAGDAAARTDLDRMIEKLPTNGIVGFFMSAMRSPGSAATLALGEAFARRKEVHEFRAAAAILLSGPGRVEEVPFLAELLASSWREDRRPTWQQVARALGVTGDPRAVEALERARAIVPEGTVHAGGLRNSLDVGLALAEREGARERVLASLSQEGGEWVAVLYANGLLARWAGGDEGALARIEALWKSDPPGAVRIQLLYGCVMAEKPPTSLPLNDWAELAADASDPLAKAIGLIWRFRGKAADSGKALLEHLRLMLRGDGMDGDLGGETAEVSAALDILRALIRWG